MTEAKAGPVTQLLGHLKLDGVAADVYRGTPPQDGRPQVFGGFVTSQALIAAQQTVEGRAPHSLHGYFLRSGNPKLPIRYEVERLREGKAFATRRVVAYQEDLPIFNMSASFHRAEEGLSHQETMPQVPAPETLRTVAEGWADALKRSEKTIFKLLLAFERPFEHREVVPIDFLEPEVYRGTRSVWFKTVEPLPDDADLHRALLTYASDFGMVAHALIAHGTTWLDPKIMVTSLDHAIWFHRPARVDGWLLYVTESPSTGAGRGMTTGRIYRADGTLVATTAQECLLRTRTTG